MRAAFIEVDGVVLRRERSQLLRFGRSSERHLRRQAHALIADHRRRRHVVILIASSPGVLTDTAAKEIHADGVIHAPANPSVGSADPHWRTPAIRQFCRRYGFPAQFCYGYAGGACDADYGWLDAIGHAAAVNPPFFLRGLVRAHGWRLLDLEASRFKNPPHL